MKKPAASVLLAAISVPALAADVSDRLIDCADIRDSRDRLACFDREIAPLHRARTTAAEPARPASPVAAVPSVAPRDLPSTPAPPPPAAVAPAAPAAGSRMGEEQISRPRGNEVQETLRAHISALRQGASGTYVVTLDNGQAWRHEDQIQGEYLKVGDAITISKGSLGSYRMTRDAGASRNWIRVTRIR